MIIITKTTAAADSVIMFNELPNSKIRKHENRLSRTATLDGGAVFDSRGYAVGDRVLTIRARLTKALADKLWAHFKSELYSNISTNDGFFYGAISELDIDRGETTITFLVKE